MFSFTTAYQNLPNNMTFNSSSNSCVSDPVDEVNDTKPQLFSPESLGFLFESKQWFTTQKNMHTVDVIKLCDFDNILEKFTNRIIDSDGLLKKVLLFLEGCPSGSEVVGGIFKKLNVAKVQVNNMVTLNKLLESCQKNTISNISYDLALNVWDFISNSDKDLTTYDHMFKIWSEVLKKPEKVSEDQLEKIITLCSHLVNKGPVLNKKNQFLETPYLSLLSLHRLALIHPEISVKLKTELFENLNKIVQFLNQYPLVAKNVMGALSQIYNNMGEERLPIMHIIISPQINDQSWSEFDAFSKSRAEFISKYTIIQNKLMQ